MKSIATSHPLFSFTLHSGAKTFRIKSSLQIFLLNPSFKNIKQTRTQYSFHNLVTIVFSCIITKFQISKLQQDLNVSSACWLCITGCILSKVFTSSKYNYYSRATATLSDKKLTSQFIRVTSNMSAKN